MANIFICYRRDDSLPWTGRLHEHFARHFGAEHVFVDIDSIAPGEDFLDVVRSRVEACDVFVPVIGRTWMAVADAIGKRRIDDPDDYVRSEIAAALDSRKRIVPVIVGGARMPEKRDLPEDIAALATRNAFAVDDLRFADDVRRLIGLLERTAKGGKHLVPNAVGTTDTATVTAPQVSPQVRRSAVSARVAWLIGGGAAAALALLIAGRLLLVDQAMPLVEPAPILADTGAGTLFFNPTNSPSVDVETMKLKRVIDSNKQSADVERAGVPLRSGAEKPNLGVLLEPVSEMFAQALGLHNRRGAMISETARGGIAQQAGLRRGDVIVRINTGIVADVDDFERKLGAAAVGDTVSLDVWRILGASVSTFTITVVLPDGSETQATLRSIEKRALEFETAANIMKKYDETARAAIEKMNR